jgi:hypothetical protein
MRTYYRDNLIHITSLAIQVGDRLYALADVDDLWLTRRRVTGRRVLTGAGVLLLAGVFTAVVRYTWWFGGLRRRMQEWLAGGFETLAVVGAAAMVLAILGVLAVEVGLLAIEDIRGHRRRLELWASVRGRPVLLLRCNDADRFGRVCRALSRAHGNAEWSAA